jgi:predicted ABC-type exoprotein transport system permease subunit
MGFLEKRNSRATLKSICKSAAIGSILMAVAFVVLFLSYSHPMYHQYGHIVLPAFMLIGAFVCAVYEWQVPNC